MRLSRSPDHLQQHYDTVVVGSGYGGGVAAMRLAQAGKRVAVLERGQEWQPGDFPARFPDLSRQLHVSGGKLKMGAQSGLIHFRMGSDVHVLTGNGLGGGSLINAGVALRPDDRVFADSVWPSALEQRRLLDRGYELARAMLTPSACPDKHGLPKVAALAAASDGLAGEHVDAETTIRFVSGPNGAGVEQAACTLCGDCCSGCNVGAKTTVTATYLSVAHRHGAELFTGCQVRSLARDGEYWLVHFESHEGRQVRRGTVRAEQVMLAAGTLGTNEILLRSREQAGLMLSDRLGHGFTSNGDIIAFAYNNNHLVHGIGIGHPAKIDKGPVGPCVASQIKVHDADNVNHSMYIQEGVLPSPAGPVLPALFVPGGRILSALTSLIKGVYDGPLSKTQTYFVVSHDSASGEIRLLNDRAAIHWPDIGNEPVFSRVDGALGHLAARAGGTYVKNPFAETTMGSVPATAHPLGGCAMADSRADGVIDHKGRVFDASTGRDASAVYPGLYVCDGAVMARSLGCNPLLTITALAERMMLLMAAEYGLKHADGLEVME